MTTLTLPNQPNPSITSPPNSPQTFSYILALDAI